MTNQNLKTALSAIDQAVNRPEQLFDDKNQRIVLDADEIETVETARRLASAGMVTDIYTFGKLKNILARAYQ
jgi:hypothetical protein